MVQFVKYVKTLGLIWFPSTDTFSFALSIAANAPVVTIRTIPADIVKLFHPLSLLCPVNIRTPMFVQALWLMPLSWDDVITDTEIPASWKVIRSELQLRGTVSISRYKSTASSVAALETELHGCYDVSEKAYAAAAYVHTSIAFKISVRLLYAKTRLAPIKQVTQPCLELLGAVLVTRLMKSVLQVLPTTRCIPNRLSYCV